MNVGEELSEKFVAIIVQGGKMTVDVLKPALEKVLDSMKRDALAQLGKVASPKSGVGVGKQSVKSLVKQGAGVTNIEITDQNIKAFEPVARKYGIDFALKKDATETPPKWMVFFKARDADAMTAAFKEFTAKTAKRDGPQKPSLMAALKQAKELAAKLIPDKVKLKDRGAMEH